MLHMALIHIENTSVCIQIENTIIVKTMKYKRLHVDTNMEISVCRFQIRMFV